MPAFNHNILWLSSIRYSNLVYPGEYGGRGRRPDHCNEKMRSREKWLNGTALAVCLCMILYITVFSRTPDLNRSAQLVPFSSLKAALFGDTRTGLQIAANIILFLPFGYLLRKLPRAALAALLLSVAVELLQYRLDPIYRHRRIG